MVATRVTQTVRASGTASGAIWAAGNNTDGWLGLGPASSDSTALDLQQTVPLNGRATLVAAGMFHSLALDAYGMAYAWGANQYGELGLGSLLPPGEPAQRPERILQLPEVIALAAGSFHSLAVDAGGAVWAWGNNEKGQLGDGTTTNRSTPALVAGLSEIVAVTAGLNFSLALGADGLVRSWGANTHGQLGAGTTTDRIQPGTVHKLEHVMVISGCGGGEHCLALTADGRVWGWGFNGHGQLGNGTTKDRSSPLPLSITEAIGIAAGAWHSVVLLSDGAVKAAGANESGQLGDGTKNERHKFDFVTVPEGDDPDPNIPLTNVVEVASGGWHNLARIVDGHVRAWGAGNAGRMGTGSEADHLQPVLVQYAPNLLDPSSPHYPVDFVHGIAAGSMHSLVVRTFVIQGDSSIGTSPVWAWGIGDHGQLIGNASPPSTPYAMRFAAPLPLTDLPGPAIAARREHSLSANHGEVWVWGPSGSGSTFTNDPKPVTWLISTFPTDVVAIAAGGVGGLALTSSGELWSWTPGGVVAERLLVIDDQKIGRNCTAIALGRQHGLVVTADGSVWCWGRNNRGQLGNGSAGAQWQSQPSRVPLNGATAVAAGADHSLALLGNGVVWAWGANDKGQLGNNSTADAASPVFVRGSAGAALRAKTISAGAEHSLAVDGSGRAWAWGSNSHGQLGIATAITHATTAAPVVWAADGRRPPAMRAVKMVAGGDVHSLALVADGRVFGWGANTYGQLGDGTTTTHGPSSIAPVSWLIPPDDHGAQAVITLSGVTSIAAGPLHSLAVAL